MQTTTPISRNTAAIIEQVPTTLHFDKTFSLTIFSNFTDYDELFKNFDETTYELHTLFLALKTHSTFPTEKSRLTTRLMIRNLHRNKDFIIQLFLSYSSLYTNNEKCIAISEHQFHQAISTKPRKLHYHHIHTNFLRPSEHNSILTQQMRHIRDRIEYLHTINLTLITNSSIEELDSLIHRAARISERIIFEIRQNSANLNFLIPHILNAYDILTPATPFNNTWHTITQRSKFHCHEHQHGKIFIISIPIIISGATPTYYFYTIPIINDIQTLQLNLSSKILLGNLQHPKNIVDPQYFFKHCYPIQNTFFCKSISQDTFDTTSCLGTLLATQLVTKNCTMLYTKNTKCISQPIGFQNKSFLHACHEGHRSWILPFYNNNVTSNIYQLEVDLDKFDTLDVVIKIHHDTFSPKLFVISITITVCALYFFIWSIIFTQTWCNRLLLD